MGINTYVQTHKYTAMPTNVHESSSFSHCLFMWLDSVVCVVRMLRVYFIINSAANYTLFPSNLAVIEALDLISNIAKYI